MVTAAHTATVYTLHISFTTVIWSGGIGKSSVTSGKAPRRILFTFCNLQKIIVLWGRNVTKLYFANLKVKQFSKSFDWHHIFLLPNQPTEASGRHRWHRERHQQEWYLRYVTCCVTKNKYFDLFKALITAGLLFTWIFTIIFRLLFPEKWKAKQLYKNFVFDRFLYF